VVASYLWKEGGTLGTSSRPPQCGMPPRRSDTRRDERGGASRERIHHRPSRQPCRCRWLLHAAC
jgi:hypothetical protein